MIINGSIASLFDSADVSDLPPLDDLDDRQRTFWVLRVGQEVTGIEVMTPAEISTVLRDAYSIDLSRQRIEGILSKERGTVAKRKKNGQRAYQLMGAGRKELDKIGSAVIFIEPSQAFTKLREVHSILASVSGDVRVCDPYVDSRTLDTLAECSNAGSIQLLTVNVKKPTGFRQVIKAFVNEHNVPLEVRVAQRGVLHDRFLIYDNGMLLFGTSFNGLGLKQSFVVALGEDIRASVLAAFEVDWQRSTPL